MMMMNSNGSARSLRSPFTATQWQELEHQALIFKYMVSGVPIPPDLIYNVKRSLESSSSRLFPHQPIGWGCFQMGFGRKVDPEPGRCRRTDGKKWRCSKEAYPDSKYCERHMHRGRNRSRKPVESQSLNSPTPKTPTQSINSASFFINSSHSDSSSRPGSVSFPQNSNTQNLFLGSGSSSQTDHKDYRYVHGMMREGLDEQALFPESSGTVRTLLPVADSYTDYKGFSQTQYQNLSTNNPNQEQEHDHHQQQQQQQHCFVLGTDFKSATARPIKLEKESEGMKPLHHFFGDWTPKSTDSWLDLASNSGLHADG